MVLCLAAAHASIFNTPCHVFFRLNQRVKLFLYHSYIFTSKHFRQLSKCSVVNQSRLSAQILKLQIHSSELLQHTYECHH